MPRNPDWSRDELILALELYLRRPGKLPPMAEVLELSERLRKLAGHVPSRTSTFRNDNSVLMKLGNIQAIDPQFTDGERRKGLTRGGKTERIVWEEFAGDPERLRLVAAAISSASFSNEPDAAGDGDDQFVDAAEGRILSRMHKVRERNVALRRRKVATVLKAGARIRCEACSFDFGHVYGSHGEGFIEVHHLRPLHELSTATRTRLGDLALVCANCHRMIHARRPWLSIEELRALIQQSLK